MSCDATNEPLMVDAPGAARIIGISARHFRRLHAVGRTPRGIHLGRRVLWRVDELRDWVAAGCPARPVWESLRKVTA